MPDETDTLTTSQSSTQNFALDATGEGKSQSSSSSQSMDQGLSNVLANSATGVHTLAQALSEQPYSTSQQNVPNISFDRREIPVLRVTPSGVDPLSQILSDSDTNHYFVNDDPLVVLEVVSQAPDDQTVTIETSYTQDELELEERVVSIPAGATKYIGNFPFYVYNFEIIKVNVNPSNNSLRFRAFKVM